MPEAHAPQPESLLIPSNWEVPKVFRRRLGEHAGRQRSMYADGHILLILHEVPEPGSSTRKGHLYWRMPDGRWKCVQGSDGLRQIKDLIRRYENQIDQLEAAVISAHSSQDYFAAVSLINPLYRTITNAYKAIESATTSLPEEPRDMVILRDMIHEQERAAFLIASDAKLGLDFTLAQQTEEQSRISLELAKSGHRLNLLVGMFLPVTAIGSVFGMNLINGLEEVPPYLFWGLFAMMLAIGFIIRSFIPSPQLEPGKKKIPSLNEVVSLLKKQISPKE